MTITDAWYEIFLAYSTPRGGRTEWQLSLIDDSGICDAINHLWIVERLINYPLRNEMLAAVYNSMPSAPYKSFPGASCSWFCSLKPRANDILRADWCYLQYLMSGGK